jgi:hypothetical protein
LPSSRFLNRRFVVPIAWLNSTSRTQIVQPLGLLLLVIGIGGLLWP